MTLLWMAKSSLLLLSILASVANGEIKEYDESQVFVIDVIGTCFDEQLGLLIRPVVDATILAIFKKNFGPYTLLSSISSTNAAPSAPGNNRRLPDSCPANCNLNEQTRKYCLAMNCVSGGGRRRRLGANDDQCYYFDASATELEMNNVLANISSGCEIGLSAHVKTVEDYNAASPSLTSSFSDLTALDPIGMPNLAPVLAPTQCPIVTSCTLQVYGNNMNQPTKSPSERYHTCVPTNAAMSLSEKSKKIVKSCMNTIKPCLCKSNRCVKYRLKRCTLSAGDAGVQEHSAVVSKWNNLVLQTCN